MDPSNKGKGFWLALFNCPHLWESLMYLPGLAQGRVVVATKQGLGGQ